MVAGKRSLGRAARPTRVAALDSVSADRHADISKFFRACDGRSVGIPALPDPHRRHPRETRRVRAAPHEALAMEAQVRGRGDTFRRPPPVWAGQRLAERLHC